ncbi:MAG: hypothetical protein V3T05_10855 [Myxococcota bacterium]
MTRRRVQTLIAVLLWAASWGSASYGCGADELAGGKAAPPPSIELTVHNRSEFELLEIRIHSTPDYRSSDNLLLQPLAHDAQVTFVGIPNHQYLTVIRRRVEAGKRIAFTTAHRLEMKTNRQLLYVFQESFRLVALDNVDPPEGGPIDGGGDNDSGDNGSDSMTPGDP